MPINRPFAVEAELRAIADGKPAISAEMARLMLAALADLSERFNALEEELDEIADGEVAATR